MINEINKKMVEYVIDQDEATQTESPHMYMYIHSVRFLESLNSL